MISTVSHAHLGALGVHAYKAFARFVGRCLVFPLQRATQVLMGRDVEESCQRVVGCRWPVFATPQGRTEGHCLTFDRLMLHSVGGASGLRIKTRERVLFHKGLGIDKLDGIGTAL